MIVRGELWWADLGLPRGSAPALRRPVLIVSADQYIRSKVRTVTVVVLTTLEERIGLLPDWLLAQADAGLQRALGLARR